MAKASSSGFQVIPSDVPKILAMIARGDRQHDIAAWFGLNQGRVADVEQGKFGRPAMPADLVLLPNGSHGPKARQLRIEVVKALDVLSQQSADGVADVVARLTKAVQSFDKNAD